MNNKNKRAISGQGDINPVSGRTLSSAAMEVIRTSSDPLVRRLADPDPDVAKKAARQIAERNLGFKANF
jgi:hypothetical protein